MPSAAAVIDLASFRASRAPKKRAPQAPATPMPMAYAPFWVVWVPAWPVR